MRLRRKELGISQQKLGRLLGITFQQVQKYETGVNRVGASRLHDLAAALEVPVSYFFPEAGAPEPAEPAVLQHLGSREAVEMVRAFAAIENDAVRKALLNLTRALGRASTRCPARTPDPT